MSVLVTVNGERRELDDGATIASVVELLSGAQQGRGVAVAVDGQVVPQTVWSQTQLPSGAQLEIVSAVQGG